MKLLTTLTGPSCAGKSTLEEMMRKRGAMKAVSTTTRQPRAGEVDGVDYYFVSHEKFNLMKASDLFIEAVQFGEHQYGLSVPELERLYSLGNHVVVVCEPIGAKQIARYCAGREDIHLESVFVDNPESVIADRFLRRATEDIFRAAIKMDGSHRLVIEAYSKRLIMMSGIEREWVVEAYGTPKPGDFHYTQILTEFNEENGQRIADRLTFPMPVVTG